jgi:predicted transcriptional regulator of viral defense system
LNDNRERTLSPLESKVVLALEWEERPVVTRAEIVERLGGSPQRADQVSRSLRAKNWLERLSRGLYVLIPADRGPEGIPDANLVALARHLLEEYYVGFATAAAHHRLSPQSRTTVHIATTRHVADRQIRGTWFRFTTVVPRKFFGFQPTAVFDEHVNISDLEKTVIDCVDRPDCAGGMGEVSSVISRAARKLDWEKFCRYASRFNSVACVQRFGYLADTAGVDLPRDARIQLKSMIKKNSRSFLGSVARWGRAGRYDPAWQVLVNVPPRELLSEL